MYFKEDRFQSVEIILNYFAKRLQGGKKSTSSLSWNLESWHGASPC